jgi:TIR domain
MLWGKPVPDVFISYSRHDQEAVARLAQKVEAEGYDVWWDAELPPHKSYGDVITEKIGSAKAAIVVWSETAAQSEWVRAEADVARNQKKLIQTALGDLIPPLPFNQIQFANIGDWQGEDDHSGWRKVMASLNELCGERQGTAAATAASIAPPPPPSPPPPAPEPVAQAPAPSKWPLFAGIGIAALAVVAAGAFILGSLGSDYGEDFEADLADLEIPEEGSGPVPQAEDFTALREPEPAPTQDFSAAPRAGGSGGRRVACYFSNPMGVYDGACAFRSGAGGDFSTTSLEGPYLMDINQIGLDVIGDGVGMLQIYSQEFGVESLPVTRSTADRACWQGEEVVFCAR